MKIYLTVFSLYIFIGFMGHNLTASSISDIQACSNMKEINLGTSNITLEEALDSKNDLNCTIIVISSQQNLTSSIIISSVNLITITSESLEKDKAVINCNNNSGLIFQNFFSVTLRQISFVGCGVEHNLTQDGFVSLESAFIGVHFRSGSEVTLSNCTFERSPGVGVLMNDVDGAITVVNSTFAHNVPSQLSIVGGGLIIHSYNLSNLSVFSFLIVGCTFDSNQQSLEFSSSFGSGGGLTVLLGGDDPFTNITITDTKFVNNLARRGGGMHLTNFDGGLNLTIFSCEIKNNVAQAYGGGAWISSGFNSCFIAIEMMGMQFNNNTARRGGGLAIQTAAEHKNAITLHALDSNWTLNVAKRSGSGVLLKAPITNLNVSNTTKFILYSQFSNCHFIQNEFEVFRDVGAVFAESSRVDFSECDFRDNRGTGLYLQHNSYSRLAGNVTFQLNVGVLAAAIYISANSLIALEPGVVATFSLNRAYVVNSGTIFVDQSTSLTDHLSCIFENLENVTSSDQYKVKFSLNTVKEDYRSIFITDAVNCFEDGRNLLVDNNVFEYTPNNITQIASLGQNVSINGTQTALMPGESFQIIPEVHDIFGNPSAVSGYLLLLVDQTHYNCILCNLKYELVGPAFITMDSSTQNSSLFSIKGPQGDEQTTRLVTFLFDDNQDTVLDTKRSFTIHITRCKPGFSFNDTEQICKCSTGNTVSNNLLCHSNDYSCVRIGYWHGINDNENSSVVIPCPGFFCQYNNILGCNHMEPCPSSPGYCRLDNLAEQCSNGREGILCSYCKNGYAFTFGAVQCMPVASCTGAHTGVLLLAILSYWVVSILIIFVVLTLNLSIGSGFMYGIVYYFSVINLYTENSLNDSFLSTLVHVCTAFSQMNPRVLGHAKWCFAESWNRNIYHHVFDYVTPLFIITFISLLLASSRFCSRWPKRISFTENSPIHAICILILFSSSSLSFTSFEILKPLSIYGDTKAFIEPNYTYFRGDHLPYAVVAVLVQCFISLPICFLLLFAPLMSKRVDLVKWKLKPILDEFQACYRSGCRWFAGFYFLARQLVYLTNAFNHTQSLPQDNIILHYLNVVILLVHVSFQPYVSKWLNALDAFLLADILMISFPESVSLDITNHTLHLVFIYALILLPSLYLMGIFFGLLLKRFHSCASVLCFSRIPARLMVNQDAFERSSKPTYSTIAIHDQSESTTNSNESFEPVRDNRADSFYEDKGEREPLLAKSHESLGDTVSTMRLSSMAKLPRFLTSSRHTHSVSVNN